MDIGIYDKKIDDNTWVIVEPCREGFGAIVFSNGEPIEATDTVAETPEAAINGATEKMGASKWLRQS